MHVLVLGPAASGKSLLTARFGAFLARRYRVRRMNLDPGVESLPYVPDFDVRSKFTLEKVMKEEGLGPNGAMLRAIDKLGSLKIPRYADDFVLLDTPGQVEPFVFRDAGPRIVSRLPDCCCIYILDASSPVQTFPSLFLYSLAAQFSLGAAAVNVVNKVDLLGSEDRERIRRLLEDPRCFLELGGEGLRYELNTKMAKMMEEYLPAQRPCLVSAKTGKGFGELLDMLHEVKCACGDLT
jgi:GTPase SAR1 family protein